MKKLVILGTGSFGELAQFFFETDSDYDVAAFATENRPEGENRLRGLPLVDFETVTRDYPPASHDLFVAIGYTKMNAVRRRLCEAARAKGYTLASYVSSRATCFAESIGDNCFIFEDNTVQPFVTIGAGTVLWSGNHIGHHSTLGDYVFIASHAVVSGHVSVGDHTFIGVQATIRDGVTLGEACLVGAGALVLKPLADKQVIMPMPSKILPQTSDELDI